jgi:hypothetical protein
MSPTTRSLLACLPSFALFAAGCSQEPASTAPAQPAASSNDAPGALSAADQALADKQKVCPVTDGELGSMGTPIKVMVKDRPVFICCDHCKEPLLADPDKFLAKLDAAAAEPAKPADAAAPAAAPGT